MPLEAPGGPLKTTYGFIGEELSKSHSYANWLAKRSLTADTITAEVSDTDILAYTTEGTGNGVWSGEVRLLKEGQANLILTLSAGGRVKKTVFKYVVRDPQDA